jgi:hypothetical protein
MSAIAIRELTPQDVDDYLRFFDCEAFADNPSWSYCYCAFYDHKEWGSLPPTPESRDSRHLGRYHRSQPRQLRQVVEVPVARIKRQAVLHDERGDP